MINLPTEKSVVTNYNPVFTILYGKPKSGKTSIAAAIEDNLIIDLEGGTRSLSCLNVQVRNMNDLREVMKALKDAIKTNEGKYPYKYLTIDNATRLEEMCLPYAAELYRNTAMGKSWGYKQDARGLILRDPTTKMPITDPKADVRTLASGSGYLYMRQAIKNIINSFKDLSEGLILICHTKDKQITMNSQEMSEMTVDLAGKTGDILMGEADAIGFVYREGKKTFVSFEGGDNIIREARPLHLRGKKFCVGEADENNNVKFNVSEIFINDKK